MLYNEKNYVGDKMNNSKMISIVVPCYNEQESLPFFYNETNEVMRKIGYNYEIILVDDGSKDRTLSVMKELSEKDSHIKYYSLSRNFGKESAIYAGFCNACGDYVTVMDADMQDPPTLLPHMIEILESNDYDSVATRRVTRQGEPHIRSWFARQFYRIINRISDTNIVDGARDFRLMRREMVDAIIKMCEYNRFSKGLFGWIGFRTYWLTFENVERVAGKTKWSFCKLFKYAIDGILDFSSFPSYIPYIIGIPSTIISMIVIFVNIILKYVMHINISDLTFIIFAIIFMGGIQLCCLGVLGQYISKTYLETKQRPHFIISETNNKNATRIK